MKIINVHVKIHFLIIKMNANNVIKNVLHVMDKKIIIVIHVYLVKNLYLINAVIKVIKKNIFK